MPRSRGHDGNGDGPDDGATPRRRDGDGWGDAGSTRAQENLIADVVRMGRSTADGGAGGRNAHPETTRTQVADLLTERTGRPGDPPSGHPTHIEPGEDDVVRRSLEMENSGATVIAGQGYRIRQNPTKGETAQARLDADDLGDPGKDPDYLIEGRVFDCYSPVKPTKAARGIWSEVKGKVDDGQTQRVVVNLEDWRGDMAALRAQFADWPIDGLKEVAERAFPEAAERPVGIAPRLTANHHQQYGFDVTIVAGQDGYLDLETDDGSWEWEPESYIRVVFRLDKDADARWAATNMLAVVRRVLDTGEEDATFDFNGDILLFARRGGQLTKHRRGTWWERYPEGNQLIGG